MVIVSPIEENFQKVTEILPVDFDILSVSVSNMLVSKYEMIKNISKLLSLKVLDKVLAGKGF